MQPATQAACEAALSALALASACLDAEAQTEIASNNPPDLVRFYADLREQAEALRDAIARFSKLEQALSYQHIPAAFDAAGISSVRVRGYGMASLVRRWSCSMIDKAQGYAYLREHGQGGMIIETVPASTLGAWAREETEEKGIEPPEEIFKTTVARHVRL